MVIQCGLVLKCPAGVVHLTADPRAPERVKVTDNELTLLLELREEAGKVTVFILVIQTCCWIVVVEAHELGVAERRICTSKRVPLVYPGVSPALSRKIPETYSRMEVDLDLRRNKIILQEVVNHILDIVCCPTSANDTLQAHQNVPSGAVPM